MYMNHIKIHIKYLVFCLIKQNVFILFDRYYYDLFWLYKCFDSLDNLDICEFKKAEDIPASLSFIKIYMYIYKIICCLL